MKRFQRNSKNKSQKGFTVVELLIVVAILVVLMAVGFIAGNRIIKNTRQAHLDKRAEAIYYAAQSRMMELYVTNISKDDSSAGNSNLSILQKNISAKIQGVNPEGYPGDQQLFYLTSDGSTAQATEFFLGDDSLSAELNGSGANWIIEYDPVSLGVYSVVFSEEEGNDSAISNYSGSDSNAAIRGNVATRRETYNARIGYYSAGSSFSSADKTTKGINAGAWIINKEKLTGIIRIYIDKDTYKALEDAGASINFKLKLKGVISEKEVEISASNIEWVEHNISGLQIPYTVFTPNSFVTCSFVIDSLDKNKQFKDFAGTSGLIPGEDIQLSVELSDSSSSGNSIVRGIKAESEPENSLFASFKKKQEGIYSGKNVAEIVYPRHLQNLSNTFSEVDNSGATGTSTPINAVLLKDIEWDAEKNKMEISEGNKEVRKFVPISNENTNDEICFFTGKLTEKDQLLYDAGTRIDPCYVITGVRVDETTGNGGLFGTLSSSSETKAENVILQNFNVKAPGSCGAFAGELKNAEITNILVYNGDRTYEDGTTKAIDETDGKEINGSAGAGGLIGKVTGGKITGCAASVYVNSSGNAGGLVGTVTEGTVITSSYSGGHTKTEGEYSGIYSDEVTGDKRINVIGSNAGGLVGSSNGATIESSYSTCSATGSSATGGLIGSSAGDSIKDCYAVGSVKNGNGQGALCGTSSSTFAGKNYYLGIVNEKEDSENGYTHVHAIGGQDTNPENVLAIDEDPGETDREKAIENAVKNYNEFMKSGTYLASAEDNAIPYDNLDKKYIMKTVKDLGGSDDLIFASSHYGDWPLYESFIINSGNGSARAGRNLFFESIRALARGNRSEAPDEVIQGNESDTQNDTTETPQITENTESTENTNTEDDQTNTEENSQQSSDDTQEDTTASDENSDESSSDESGTGSDQSQESEEKSDNTQEGSQNESSEKETENTTDPDASNNNENTDQQDPTLPQSTDNVSDASNTADNSSSTDPNSEDNKESGEEKINKEKTVEEETEEEETPEYSEGEVTSTEESVKILFGEDAMIPEGAELLVSEITEDDEEYQNYIAQAAENLSLGIDEVASFKVLDLKITKDGEEIQPNADVKVEINTEKVYENKEVYADDDISVVHLKDDGAETLESEVKTNEDINTEEIPETTTVPADTISFDTDGFSVYVFVQPIREKVTEATGDGYNISVTYDNASGIPAGTVLNVSEIPADSEKYEQILKAYAERHSAPEDIFELVRPFEISFTNPETGEEVQPGKDVNIKFVLQGEILEDYALLEVAHIHGDNISEMEILEPEMIENGVSVMAGGFSTFALFGSTVDPVALYEGTPICKVTLNGVEKDEFSSLTAAMEYIMGNLQSQEVYIEMLNDYVVTETDKLSVNASSNITLTSDRNNNTTIFKITRSEEVTLIENNGALKIENINLDGNNIEADNSLITNTGSLTIDGTTRIENCHCTGNGGVISSSAGTVTVAQGSICKNIADGNGGAIYNSGTGTVVVSGAAILGGTDSTDDGNSAANGGAIYSELGAVSVTGSGKIKYNSASSNGGGIYIAGGTFDFSEDADISSNTSENGAGIYFDAGIANLSGGTIKENSASGNGSAIYNNSGAISFNGNIDISANRCTGDGGAVGIGSTSATLNFSGNPKIIDNTDGDATNPVNKNVYLDKDSDTIINATGIGTGAEIGIYVPDSLNSQRGTVGCSFGTYTNNSNISAFKNDRESSLVVVDNTTAKKIEWGNGFTVKCHYLQSFQAGFPPVAAGTDKYTESSYSPKASTYYTSQISADLYQKVWGTSNTATYATAFNDEDTSYSDYIKAVIWDTSNQRWNVIKYDGTETPMVNNTIHIYYSGGTFFSIENNTNMELTVSNLQVLNNSVISNTTNPGYGLIYFKNGVLQDKLVPVTESDMVFAAGDSITVLVPGGAGQTYNFTGRFTAPYEATFVRRTGETRQDYTAEQLSADLTYTGTIRGVGQTYQIVFGDDKPICKIVNNGEITFSSLKEAVDYAKDNNLRTAKIEMLTDYLLPGTDSMVIPEGYDITLTTAKSGERQYPGDRATISRDSSHRDSFISGSVNVGGEHTKLKVENLILDGKSITGISDGGAIRTRNITVTIDNVSFKNFIAKDGGAIFNEYNAAASFDHTNRSIFIVNKCVFENCVSNANTNRNGGGAIWTNAFDFRMTDSSFKTCTAYDQGGGVFHRIDYNYNSEYRSNSKSVVSGCTFENCNARAAGGLELDAFNTTVTDCKFTACQATQRNGGGLNIFIHISGDGIAGNTEDATATITGCTFTNCYAVQNGGGLRSMAKASTVSDCQFYNTTSNENGGAISATNKFGQSMTVANCLINGCNATTGLGGGIHSLTENLTVDTCTISGCYSGKTGGGIYAKNINLQNSYITGNRVEGTNPEMGAGIYLQNNYTLSVGRSDATQKDNSTVRGNYTTTGMASNTRLSEISNGTRNSANSVYVYCDLSGQIYVVNAKILGTQFGSSEYARPVGFVESIEDYRAFRSDDGNLYGTIDETDSSGKKIIWGGPPICKITDDNGNLLYLDNEGHRPAVFNSLDNGTTGAGISGAFTFLKYERNNLKLYYKDGTSYQGGTFYVKMLVETYTARSYISTNIKNDTWMKICLTTAGADDTDGYPYRGSAGTRSTIFRGSTVGAAHLITCKVSVTLENIIIDGRNEPCTVEGSLLYNGPSTGNTNGSKYATIEVGNGAILQNGRTAKDGGAIYVTYGNVVINGGIIRNCHADKNGGAVYMASMRKTDNPPRGLFTFNSGSISWCSSDSNGGGIFVGNNAVVDMNGGSITNCSAVKGGGVYIDNDAASYPFNMNGGSITNNTASQNGAGIAFKGNNSRIYFRGAPVVAYNKLTSGQTCNVELNHDTNLIINTTGLTASAHIGVYVPGTKNTNSNYDKHGLEGKPFGQFVNNSDKKTLYCFVNDRNGLKGGVMESGLPNTIYWVKLFSLEISKDVKTSSNIASELIDAANNEKFTYEITLTGKSSDNLISADSIDGEYGGITFHKGENKSTATVKLKNGERVTAETLPAGIRYKVEEKLTDEQKKKYAVASGKTVSGTIGENMVDSRPESEWYISRIKYVNINPVCKITDGSGNLLYQLYKEGDKFKVPAVYTELADAIQALDGRLYTTDEDIASQYNGFGGCRIEMLVENYNLPAALTLKSGKTVVLKTAAQDASLFPYRGTGGTLAEVKRNYDGASMFTVNGDMTVREIQLDGAKSDHVAEGNGGILYVKANGKARLEYNAKLKNSRATGNGGAVYVEPSGLATMSGALIDSNNSDGYGAGIYLAEGSTLELSGAINFGGDGVDNFGNIDQTGNIVTGTQTATNGGKNYPRARQDIYIAETGNDPASLVITGNLTGGAGSVWVWAESEKHYVMMKPFARTTISSADITSESYLIFRNAQKDNLTLCGGDTYITGSRGENASFIYWAGGYDISFEKIDGYGKALPGAVFTLYTDAACTVPLKRGGENATSTSADGTATYKNSKGDILTKGTVLFEKVPGGVYYMKETTIPLTDPDGQPMKYVNENVYIVLVGDTALKTYGTEGVLSEVTAEQVAAQVGTGADKADSAVFKIDEKTSKAIGELNINKYGMLNTLKSVKIVILKKINEGKVPLSGATFDIFCADRSYYAKDVVSGDAGAFFIYEMPFGVYYLYEKTAPSGYTGAGNYYKLTIDKDGKVEISGPKESIDAFTN